MLKVTTGPSEVVSGASSTPGTGAIVVHVRLMPSGDQTWLVYRGSAPCVRAHGHQCSAQMKNDPSQGTTASLRSARCGRIIGPNSTSVTAR